MHALVYTGTEKIVYREEKDPTKKPGEALVKVHASGICGSDMHAYHGKDERRIPPLILGHEFSGTSLDGKFKNKEVVINPLISCCLLYTSPSPRDERLSRMPSSA